MTLNTDPLLDNPLNAPIKDSPSSEPPNKKESKIPWVLRPLWWLGVALESVERFHTGQVKPLAAFLIGYLLVAKLFFNLPVAVAFYYSWYLIALLLLMFAQINVMLYAASRVIVSIRRHIVNKKKRWIWLGTSSLLFAADIGLNWLSFLSFAFPFSPIGLLTSAASI